MRALVVAILALALWPSYALAQKRVALVIGNSSYQHPATLQKSAGDAAAVARMLKDADFAVSLHQNVGTFEFKLAIRDFGEAAKQAEMVAVYYSGHGLTVGSSGYLIPVDATLLTDLEIEDQTVSLDRLLHEIEERSRDAKLRLVVLDACRDNPFLTSMKSLRTDTRRERRPTNLSHPGFRPGDRMLVAYPCKRGQTAEEGPGEHSPFAQALIHNMTAPGLDIRLAFGRIRDHVLRASNNKQEPFVYGSLGGSLVAIVPGAQQAAAADPAVIKLDYELVSKIGTRQAFGIFLQTYETGYYAELARAKFIELNTTEKSNEIDVLREPRDKGHR
jgi:uncharacterized caspase-like protein